MINLNPIVLITDDARMAAAISSELNGRGVYLVVLEGPRLKRPDYENEIIRLANVIHRMQPSMIIYAKQPKDASRLMGKILDTRFVHFDKFDDLKMLGINVGSWRRTMLRDLPARVHRSSPNAKRAVVCEYSTGVVPIIAANYATAHGADLYIIDTPKGFEHEVVEDLNKIASIPVINRKIREIDINVLADKLAGYLPEQLCSGSYEKIFIATKGVPYGLAMRDKEVVYSDMVNLGHHIAHNIFDYGLSRFQKQGVIGLFVANTEMSTERENELMAEALLRAKGFSKTVYGKDTRLTEWEIVTLPYDFLYIATHGNQIEGVENTYTFKDRKGREHKVVTKEGTGVGGLVVFIESVDDHAKGSNDWILADSRVWGDFYKRHIATKNMPQPLESKPSMLRMRQLVLGHEAGMMSPVNFDRLASAQRPLVIGSACGSWTDLSQRFMYAGATAYIGTLWPITDRAAIKFAEAFFPKLFAVPLIDAFTEARKSLDDGLDQLTYALSGTFESKHDPGADYSNNAYEEVMERLERNLEKTKQNIIENEKHPIPQDIKDGMERDQIYYEKELLSLQEAYRQAKSKD
jgi:hypothetical protein